MKLNITLGVFYCGGWWLMTVTNNTTVNDNYHTSLSRREKGVELWYCGIVVCGKGGMLQINIFIFNPRQRGLGKLLVYKQPTHEI